jgi:hypothetical protein
MSIVEIPVSISVPLKNTAIVGMIIAGSFVASPELRAYAAATIGSAEIIDRSIQSVDIGNGQVKTADLAGSAVNSGKIQDGEVKTADLAGNAVNSGKIATGGVDSWNSVLARLLITIGKLWLKRDGSTAQ